MLRFTDNIIAQMTLACNKHCKYCYEHINEINPLDKTPMDFETFKKYFDYTIYCRCILGKRENVIDWHFHGGEVFLLPWPTLRKMIAYIEERQNFFPNIDYCFQTNGTLITDEIACFLKSRNKMLGFSFDGYGDNDRGTEEENKKLMDNLKKLHERTGVQCSYITVITKQNKDTWLEDWRKASEFCKEFGINELCEVDDTNTLTSEEIWTFWYKPVLESYLTHTPIPERNVRIMLSTLITHLFFVVTKEDKTGCFSRRCGHGANMISLTSKGELFPCDKFLEKGDFINKRFRMGIKEPDFLGLKNVNYVYHFCKDLFKEESKLGCDICPARDFCVGDCQSYNLSRYGEIRLDPRHCLPYKNFYEFVMGNLKTILLKKKEFQVGSDELLKSLRELTPFGQNFLQENPEIKIFVTNGSIRFEEKN